MKPYLVTGVKRYSFKDQDSGRQVEGAKLHLIPGDIPNPQSDNSGTEPIVISIPYEEFGLYHGNVPCIAHIDIGFSQSNGKTMLLYTGGELKKKLDFAGWIKANAG